MLWVFFMVGNGKRMYINFAYLFDKFMLQYDIHFLVLSKLLMFVKLIFQ